MVAHAQQKCSEGTRRYLRLEVTFKFVFFGMSFFPSYSTDHDPFFHRKLGKYNLDVFETRM